MPILYKNFAAGGFGKFLFFIHTITYIEAAHENTLESTHKMVYLYDIHKRFQCKYTTDNTMYYIYNPALFPVRRGNNSHFLSDTDMHYKSLYCSESSNVNQNNNLETRKIQLGQIKLNMSHIEMCRQEILVLEL